MRVAGHDLARDPDAVRAVIGVTGQFSAVDNLLTGEENLILMADLRHLGRAEGRRRTAELLEQFDLVEAAGEAGIHLLGRHASPARPRDDPGGRPAHHLPRRADHRPRPAQPPHHVADHPRPRGRRGHDLPHDPVPGGGRPARRPDRRPRRREADRRGKPGRAQASHPRRPHPPAVRRPRRDSKRPPTPSAGPPATTRHSPCRSRATGDVGSLRTLLDQLDVRRSRSTASPSTRRISTTSSSP